MQIKCVFSLQILPFFNDRQITMTTDSNLYRVIGGEAQNKVTIVTREWSWNLSP